MAIMGHQKKVDPYLLKSFESPLWWGEGEGVDQVPSGKFNYFFTPSLNNLLIQTYIPWGIRFWGSLGVRGALDIKGGIILDPMAQKTNC